MRSMLTLQCRTGSVAFRFDDDEIISTSNTASARSASQPPDSLFLGRVLEVTECAASRLASSDPAGIAGASSPPATEARGDDVSAVAGAAVPSSS